jgi:hypothetical protein
MNTTIVNCIDDTFDLVITNENKGVKKNYTSLDLINEDQKTILIEVFIQLKPNQWISL